MGKKRFFLVFLTNFDFYRFIKGYKRLGWDSVSAGVYDLCISGWDLSIMIYIR